MAPADDLGNASSLVISSESRFQGTPDGRVWTTLSNGAEFWSTHYATFSHVTILARVAAAERPPESATEVSGPGVSVARVPDFHEPRTLLKHLVKVRAAVRSTLRASHVVIAALPGPLGLLVATSSILSRRPFAVEVNGDPSGVFGDAAVGGRLRHVYRTVFVRAMRAICKRAIAVDYVAEYLSERYPPSPTAVVAHTGGAISLDPVVGPSPRAGTSISELVTVGSLEQSYKGVADLLQALVLLAPDFPDMHLTVIGDGRDRDSLQRSAAELGIAARVRFVGHVGHEEVKAYLSSADLFVLASRTEGLPRALIEAMAQGLPCVATRVGGIPELLPDDVLVDPKSPGQLAERISELARHPDTLGVLSNANRERVSRFRPDQQARCRASFHEAVLAKTRH